jgi:hypothetical protein
MGQVIVEMGPTDSENALIAEQMRSEEIASSGTAAASTIVTSGNDLIVIHNNQAGVVWVAFGTSPTAAVGTTACLPANTSRSFRVNQANLKVSVIDDS